MCHLRNPRTASGRARKKAPSSARGQRANCNSAACDRADRSIQLAKVIRLHALPWLMKSVRRIHAGKATRVRTRRIIALGNKKRRHAAAAFRERHAPVEFTKAEAGERWQD